MSPCGRPDDRPPYAWLDDPAQPFGPVPISTTVGVGALLAGLGVLVLAYGRSAAPTRAGPVSGRAAAPRSSVPSSCGWESPTANGADATRALTPLAATRAAGANVGSPFARRPAGRPAAASSDR